MEAAYPAEMDDYISLMAQDLHRFIMQIHRPRVRDKSWSEKMARACDELSRYAARARASLGETQKSLSGLVDQVMETLRDCSGELSGKPRMQRIKELRLSLSRSYESLLIHIRSREWGASAAARKLKHLSPSNYYRNVFHVATGLLAVTLYQWVLSWRMAMALLLITLGVFLSLEIARRFSSRFNDYLVDRVFGLIVRPKERFRTNSSTYYLIGLTLMCAICPKTALELGLLILALGDPAASLAGRRFGKIKIWREKSIAGTSAFFGVALATSFGFLSLVEPGMGIGAKLLLSLAVSGAGAATELFSQNINDNFTIPVVSAGVASFWF